jgi:prevent-host-death family protein
MARSVEDCYIVGVTVIAQRELRNDISEILKRAEAGETFTITVNGKQVAQLSPLPELRREPFAALLERTPVDDAWADELREARTAERE